MVLLAPETKLPMASSPLNLQSAGVSAEKGRDLSVHVNDLFVQGVGEVEFPVFLRNERRQKCAAGISSEDKGVGCCWFFYLQQRESGTR